MRSGRRLALGAELLVFSIGRVGTSKRLRILRVASTNSCGDASNPDCLRLQTSAETLINVVLFCFYCRAFRIQPAMMGIFRTVDWANVRWIFIEIGSPDPEFLAVCVDPLPQIFG